MASCYDLGTGRIKYSQDTYHGMFEGLYEDKIQASVKVIRLCDDDAVRRTEYKENKEVDILKRISHQHDNIINFLAQDIYQHNSELFLLLAVEWCHYDLPTVLKNKVNFPSLTQDTVLHQLADGIDFLHDSDIVHFNLKPASILVKQHNQLYSFRMKIANFAYSKVTQRGKFDLSKETETPDWAAPEIIETIGSEEVQKMGHCSCDIFSLGLVYYYIVSAGKLTGETDEDARARLETVFLNPDAVIEENIILEDCQRLEQNLIRKMLSRVPSTRPSVKEILVDPALWNSSKTLKFVDTIDGYFRKNDAPFLNEGKVRQVKKQNELWKDGLPNVIKDELFSVRRNSGDKRAKYNPACAKSLIRAIRNYDHHFFEQPENVKQIYGNHPDGYLKNWKSWFPDLLPESYDFFRSKWHNWGFKPFYP